VPVGRPATFGILGFRYAEQQHASYTEPGKAIGFSDREIRAQA
jgi:hypothetical protein